MIGIVNTSIHGAVIGLLILFLKWILGDKLSPKWHMMVWIILLLKLTIPFLPESEISIFNKIPEVNYKHVVGFESYGISLVDKSSDDLGEYPIENNEVNIDKSLYFRLPLLDLASYIWLGITLLLGLFFILIYYSFSRKLQRVILRPSDEDVELFLKCKKLLSIDSEIDFYRGHDSAMLHGVFSPKIIVPSYYRSDEVEQILIHELVHLKNKDHLINMTAITLCCINWFNPILWLCMSKLKKDIEIYCDYKVIALTNNKKLYAATLIKSIAKKQSAFTLGLPMQNGGKEIMKRIIRIVNGNKYSRSNKVLGMLIILLMSSFLLNSKTDSYADSKKLFYLNSNIEASKLEEIISIKLESITIDPGHGGDDKGYVAKDNIYESDVNFSIASKLKEYIDSNGDIITSMTRKKDEYIMLDDRVAIGNGRDLLLSIHCGASQDVNKKAIEIIYNNDDSVELANIIANRIKENLDTEVCLIKAEDSKIKILKDGKNTIMINAGYLSNEDQLESLLKEDYQNKLVEAIGDSIIAK